MCVNETHIGDTYLSHYKLNIQFKNVSTQKPNQFEYQFETNLRYLLNTELVCEKFMKLSKGLKWDPGKNRLLSSHVQGF